MSVCAQETSSLSDRSEKTSLFFPTAQYLKKHNIFQHLDVSFTLGSTGIGFEASSPISDFGRLRAGFSFMPHFHYHVGMPVQIGDSPEESAAKFETLAGMLKDITGFSVDDRIGMIGVPTFHNFNLLFDFYPIKKNKHWHFTAGFYLGNSKIAEAYNTTEDMPSLVAVSLYNHMYGKAINREPFLVVKMNGGTFAFTEDPELQDVFYDKFSSYGRMGVYLGTHVSDGSPYILEPDENSMVKAEVRANSFKPYLGFGYGGRLFKGDDRYKIYFDCGALFWGGIPNVITHDGTDLANDVENVEGRTGVYIDLIQTLKVFPVISVRFTRKLF